MYILAMGSVFAVVAWMHAVLYIECADGMIELQHTVRWVSTAPSEGLCALSSLGRHVRSVGPTTCKAA